MKGSEGHQVGVHVKSRQLQAEHSQPVHCQPIEYRMTLVGQVAAAARALPVIIIVIWLESGYQAVPLVVPVREILEHDGQSHRAGRISLASDIVVRRSPQS